MDRRKRNITALGLLVVVATVAFFWGMYYLMGNPILSGGLDVVIRLPDGAGLKRGDRVYLSGVDVGLVQSVEIGASGGVLVETRVKKELRLPVDTHASVMGDVFGAHTVEFKQGESMQHLESGDTITGSPVPQITTLAADIGTQARSVLSSVDAAVDSLISPTMVGNLNATAAAMPATAAELNSTLIELRRAAAALRRTTEDVESAKTGEAINRATAEVERSAKALTAAIGRFDSTLNSLSSVIDKIDNGQGTLGRLVNDEALYNEFNLTLKEFRLLAGDIRERPGRYISLRIF
jgi:phospholipid/cholesterol/gamma-HCH transport system substrate-binding protein